MSEVLERGNIYFVYRPKVGEESAEGLDDVQRFFMVLSPHGKKVYRLIAIGRKRLPEVSDGGERLWGFVEKVGRQAREVEDELDAEHYQTKTRGERELPPVRPAGEGVYAIVRHDNHTHLAYELELPRSPGDVQQELHIEDIASYVLSVKNPEQPSPPQAGLGRGQKAHFPKSLQEQFRGRRFSEADPPDFLDHEGAELLLIGAKHDAEQELDIELPARRETGSTADIFRDLQMEKSEHPLEPLFQGDWR